MARARKWLLGIGIAVLVLIAAFFAALAWVLYTPSGLRFALDRGAAMMHGQFAYASASGTLAGETTINGLRWRDAAGDTLRIDHAVVDLQTWALLGRRIHVRKARIDGVVFDMAPAAPAKKSNGFSLDSLKPPLPIVLDDTRVTDIRVRRGGQPVFTADSLAIAGFWSADQLKLDTLDLRAPQGHVALTGTLSLASGYRGSGRATIDWTQAGTHYVGAITSRSDGKQAKLQADLSSPVPVKLDADVVLAAGHAWTMSLHVPQFEAGTVPGLPASLKTLALELRGSGDMRGGTLKGQLVANGHTVLIDPAQFAYDGKTLTLDPLRLRSPSVPGTATAIGAVHLGAKPMTASLDVAWQGVHLPADLVGQPLDTHGKIHVDGSAERFAVEGGLTVGPPGRPVELGVDLSGTPKAIELHSLKLVQKNGGLDAHGSIGLDPRTSWKLAATAKHFDPGAILAGWNGALDFNLATEGTLTPKGPQATFRLTDVRGTLRGRSIAGSHADVRVTSTNLLDGSLTLVAGQSRISAIGKPGRNTDASLTLDIAALDDWLPQAHGSLQGRFTLRGIWPKLAVAGNLHGSGLDEAGIRADSVQLTASIPDISKPGGDFDLKLTGVHASGLDFTSVHLGGHGTATSHRLSLEASGKQLGARLTLAGSWQAKARRWTGTLSDVELTPQGLPAWRQQQPTAITWQRGAATPSQFCLAAGDAHLCLSGNRSAQGAIAVEYDLRNLPLQMFASLVSGMNPLQATGTIGGSGQLTLAAGGALNGKATLSVGAGSITYASSQGQPLLAWTGIDLAINAAGTSQHLRLHGALVDGGHIDGDVTVGGTIHALAGSIDVNLRSLAFLAALTPEIANVQGSLAGRLTLAGTLAAPRFQGSIRTQGFAAELPRAGLKLRDGSFAIAGDPQGHLTVSGQVTSGKGVLHITGTAGLSAGAPFSLAIQGDNVLVADIPAAHVVASPNLKIARADGAFTISGSVTIPSASVKVEKLPGQGPTRASPDVVIVDEPQKAEAAPLAMNADIEVKLGNDVKVAGYGFDGKVHGQLAVQVRPGHTATGRGAVQVSGTYTAYGQDLTIDRGRLMFAGTRLDNPGLDIRAVRELRSRDVTVGLSIQGTAQRPVLTVFSDPAMEQAEALSYLVTGRPLNALNGGESDALNAAAQALGGLAGDRLAKSIGSRLGFEAGVANSETLGGSAFTAGKYLSPRLFISYGVGLFTPGQVITLRYTLNRFLQFEAENATTGNRASLNYKIEK
ncbi:MAG TPA: translocation/assembly module TamB domain-containing protein [Rhodanobacteraceae bacterium]|nr:translocation/assembly module TamB domain-containing protein [Rhodanobacteraceae bacterium]